MKKVRGEKSEISDFHHTFTAFSIVCLSKIVVSLSGLGKISGYP